MEIINIERKAYEDFAGEFNHFVKKMMEMGQRGTDKRLGEWMTGEDAGRCAGHHEGGRGQEKGCGMAKAKHTREQV